MTKILFVSESFPPHMKRDLKILKQHFDVDVFNLDLGDRFSRINVMKKILESDIVYSRFACRRTLFLILLSRLFRKKSVLLSGGYDVAKVPEIGYGLTLHPLEKYIVKTTLLFADKILAFSDSSKKSILECMPRANVETAYIGAIETEKFKPKGNKEDLVLTVGHVTWGNLKRKGLETFVRSARYLPNIKFLLIGDQPDASVKYLKSIAPKNMKFQGFIPNSELPNWYQKAKVYVQVSAHEGFGVSLAEGMACGCVPVVTNRGAIPEVVGDAGFYVPYNHPKATAKAIERALNDETKAKKAVERVKKLFSFEKRKDKLLKIINRVMNA